jgi:hypothetical protein
MRRAAGLLLSALLAGCAGMQPNFPVRIRS